MNKFFIGIAILICILPVACQQQKYFLCSDNVTSVFNLSNCPKEQPKCPANCIGNITCNRYFCDASTNFTCKSEIMKPCDGNGICELGEFGKSKDCIASCDDNDSCTTDSYNYVSQICFHDPIVPCCGNNMCETGETFLSCPADCAQSLAINVLKFELRQRLEGAHTDLSSTSYTYLIVDFNINNINIDRPEEIDYQKLQGFYYDPFKMKAEDDKGNKYGVEYDSDLSRNWRELSVIPKGSTVSASVTFVVPLGTNHIRLVAYDKYGSKLDTSEIY